MSQEADAALRQWLERTPARRALKGGQEGEGEAAGAKKGDKKGDGKKAGGKKK